MTSRKKPSAAIHLSSIEAGKLVERVGKGTVPGECVHGGLQ